MKVLLPIDGSEPALEAVHHAVRLVQGGLQASFVLGNVQEPASLYEVVVAHNAQVIEDVSAAAAAHALEPAQALLREIGAEFESEVVTGDAGHMLVDIAERFECDMIIMSAHGASSSGTALVARDITKLGSVANSVLHSTGLPVTIVKHFERITEERVAAIDEPAAED
jgi:nucleotide-binding universal stress UspA family protein